jgi:hypothetical protein
MRTLTMDKLIEYMNIHLISLNQDMDKDLNVQSKINIQGQIMATEHLLSVANDILNNDFQGKGY